ncbi:MAG TPA: DUF3341 domain-containing protein [Patescibacteria group bacterium]|nr:DUF3341 domain-containing protein [Patescibacteria group bacterium]
MARKRPSVYGMMAEFDSPEALLAAAEKASAAGYRRMDAYSPMPIEGLADAVGFHHTSLPLVVLSGGILGGLSGFFLQYYASVFTFSENIAGKPLNSWPAFIPITFELAILFAALFCVFGMLAMNGLPTPYHPVFNVPAFALATRDKFFLCIKARDPMYDAKKTREFMNTLGAIEVSDIGV